nr:hypothetical protein [Tanacetum cinerariifolium]
INPSSTNCRGVSSINPRRGKSGFGSSLTAEGLAVLTLAALTAEGLAALTLGGESLGLGVVCLMKGLLMGSLDFDTVYGAMWGRVLEKVGLAAPIVLAAAESTGLDLEGVVAETLCKGILEWFIGALCL